jgi:hypothetical protein
LHSKRLFHYCVFSCCREKRVHGTVPQQRLLYCRLFTQLLLGNGSTCHNIFSATLSIWRPSSLSTSNEHAPCCRDLAWLHIGDALQSEKEWKKRKWRQREYWVTQYLKENGTENCSQVPKHWPLDLHIRKISWKAVKRSEVKNVRCWEVNFVIGRG